MRSLSRAARSRAGDAAMKVIAEKTKGRSPRRRTFWIAGITVVVLAAGVVLWHRSEPAPHAAARTAPPVPVTVTTVARRDVPIFLQGLGTVQASNTIAVRSQIDGKLQSVNFVEGQEVHQGDTLAVIDPRALQAALTQAVAKKAQEQALLVAAQKELTRFKTLAAKNCESQRACGTRATRARRLPRFRRWRRSARPKAILPGGSTPTAPPSSAPPRRRHSTTMSPSCPRVPPPARRSWSTASLGCRPVRAS